VNLQSSLAVFSAHNDRAETPKQTDFPFLFSECLCFISVTCASSLLLLLLTFIFSCRANDVSDKAENIH